MTLTILYTDEDKMTEESIVKIVDNEYHTKYYGRYSEVPDKYLHKPIHGYRYEWCVYTIWLE